MENFHYTLIFCLFGVIIKFKGISTKSLLY